MNSGSLINKLCLVILLNFLIWKTIAQSFSPFTPDSLLSQISIQQWSGENGLKSNNITSTLQATSGFIWITTYNGIMRFDGVKVDVYDRSVLPFLTTDSFYKVYESNSGALYFASQASGIIMYHDGSFSKLLPNNKQLPNSIRCLLIENDSSIYAGSTDNGLFHIKNGQIEKIEHQWLDNITILDLEINNNGKLWIATDGNGIVRYDGKNFNRKTTQDGLFSNHINSIKIKNKNDVYVGTAKGFNLINGNKVNTFNAFKNLQVNHFYDDKIGRTWVATEKGLGRIDWRKNKIEFIDKTNNFPFIRLNWIDGDSEGNIWISTGRDGLLQIKKTAIVSYSLAHGISSTKINVITPENENTFLIGSDIGTIDRIQNGNVLPFNFKTNLNKAGIRDIVVDNETYWIASYQGLLHITPSSETLLTLKDGLPSIDLRRIILDRESNLWIASRSGGLFKYNGSKVIAHYDSNNGLGTSFVLALEKDKDGNIYAGTHSGGISIISPKGDITNYAITENDLGIVVFNIHVEQPKTAWIVSNKEIYFFKNEAFHVLKLYNKLSGVTYYDWLEDNNGDAWITSNLGVLKIRKQELDNFKLGKKNAVGYQLFTNQEGMRNKECSGATHATKSFRGNLWIPTVDGVAIFHPNQLLENSVVPPVYVTSLSVKDTTFYKNNFEIEPGKSRYLIKFTALSFFAPSKVKFRYKLDGFDNEWVELGNEREVEYTNLPPGKYTFKVQACNNDEIWNTEGDQINFKVKPYFRQTLTFYIIIGLVILLFFYFMYRWRVNAVQKSNRELRKVNSELDRFVYSASHDLRAPLSSILGIVSLIRIDKENSLESYLIKIETSINKLDVFIKDIIDFSRNARLKLEFNEIDFHNLIKEAIEELKYQTEGKHIDTTFTIKGDKKFYSDNKRISIILRNLISNAFRYSDKRKDNSFLKITVFKSSKNARIIVEDNGIGIDQHHLQNIYDMFYRATENNQGSGIGLYIVKETVEKLGGQINVTSNLGKGTKFIFELENKK